MLNPKIEHFSKRQEIVELATSPWKSLRTRRPVTDSRDNCAIEPSRCPKLAWHLSDAHILIHTHTHTSQHTICIVSYPKPLRHCTYVYLDIPMCPPRKPTSWTMFYILDRQATLENLGTETPQPIFFISIPKFFSIPSMYNEWVSSSTLSIYLVPSFPPQTCSYMAGWAYVFQWVMSVLGVSHPHIMLSIQLTPSHVYRYKKKSGSKATRESATPLKHRTGGPMTNNHPFGGVRVFNERRSTQSNFAYYGRLARTVECVRIAAYVSWWLFPFDDKEKPSFRFQNIDVICFLYCSVDLVLTWLCLGKRLCGYECVWRWGGGGNMLWNRVLPELRNIYLLSVENNVQVFNIWF